MGYINDNRYKEIIMRYLILLMALVCFSVYAKDIKMAKTKKAKKSVDYFKHSSKNRVSVIKNKIASSRNAINNHINLKKRNKGFVKDKRTLRHAKVTSPGKWEKVYNTEYPVIKYVPMKTKELKIIAEMQITESEYNLFKELKYFKGLGYNGVLAVWQGGDYMDLISQIYRVKAMGFKVFFAFGKMEKLTDGVFIDPDYYKRGLAALAEVCDGYLLGWRRTSIHLFKADKAWVDYSMNYVREGNPDIPIIGEMYKGYVGKWEKGKPVENEMNFRIPENISAVLVINCGYRNSLPKGALKIVRSKTDIPVINLVVGEKPYYMTRNNTGRTKSENRQIIDEIEERFRKAGFGTITLSGDGSNGLYNKSITDDLSKMHWSQTN